MNIQEIRDSAPDGALGFSVCVKLNKILYHKKGKIWLNIWKEWIAWNNEEYDIKPLY